MLLLCLLFLVGFIMFTDFIEIKYVIYVSFLLFVLHYLCLIFMFIVFIYTFCSKGYFYLLLVCIFWLEVLSATITIKENLYTALNLECSTLQFIFKKLK